MSGKISWEYVKFIQKLLVQVDFKLIIKIVINQVISYWSSYGSSVGCIGPWSNTADLGPVTGPIRNYLINNVIILSVMIPVFLTDMSGQTV